jgi:hypothetical protein
LWPAAGYLAQNGYRGVVAKKSRNRRGAGPARSSASGRPAPASAGAAPAGTVQAAATPASRAPAGTAQLTTPPAAEKSTYPGQDLGLPERGPGSVASMPRRILALFIDWLLSMLIAYGLTHSQFWTIVVFAIEVYVLTATTGFTVGKRLVGIRTVRTNGGLVGFGWALVRTVILLTVIPPLLTDRDLRGLHDRASDTVVIRV